MTPTLNRKLKRDLWNLKAQVATIALLIVCGVGVLVSTWSAYQSLKSARDSYYLKYSFADIFADFKVAPLTTIEKLRQIPGIKQLTPRIATEGLVRIENDLEPAVGRFSSVPSGEQPQLNKLHIRSGRLPVDSDRLEVVVHEGFAQAHKLGPGDELTVIIRGQREVAQIVGVGISPEYVYALSGAAPLPDDRHFGVFWASEQWLRKLTKMKDAYNSLTATLEENASTADVLAKIDRELKPFGSFGAYARDRQISDIFISSEISQQRVSSFFMPAIFLGIAAFLINIITSRLISMHRMQIATLKAIGYSKWEVSGHYLKMILIMTLIGTLPGLGVGAFLGQWMAKTYESYFRFPSLDFTLSPTSALIGIIAGILPGILGAWASIRRSFKLAPAEAMRPESPPAFHASVFDRFGLQKLLKTRARMTARHVFLRPVRLLLSVLSLSAALAIVVTSGSWSDMIEYLLDTQFHRMQREDLSMTLLRPRPTGVIQEILTLPGVMTAEGFRILPIRLRFANHKRELSLTGWPETPRIRQLLDKNLMPITVPRNGLILSRYFAKTWGMRVGDIIEIQTLDGEQKTLQIPVSGFTDDLVGTSASMRIDSLWRFLNEDPGYNHFVIQADPRRINELYVALKEKSEIATVNLKQSLYRGFRESFGSVIQSTSRVLFIASLLIALGIIYNSVRVNFSERSWELASLRVLGFSHGAISFVLLREVAVHVALSILPGCWAGWWLTDQSMKLVDSENFGFPVVIEPATYAMGILAVLLSFALSAIIVHRMVGRLNPAEALKARD